MSCSTHNQCNSLSRCTKRFQSGRFVPRLSHFFSTLSRSISAARLDRVEYYLHSHSVYKKNQIKSIHCHVYNIFNSLPQCGYHYTKVGFLDISSQNTTPKAYSKVVSTQFFWIDLLQNAQICPSLLILLKSGLYTIFLNRFATKCSNWSLTTHPTQKRSLYNFFWIDLLSNLLSPLLIAILTTQFWVTC
jgi:hypothetical protein